MIIFGQGAIRYRPYAYLELKARHFVGKGSSCSENITEEEAKVLEQTNLAREEADKVDSFSLKEFKASLMEVAVASDSKGHAAG